MKRRLYRFIYRLAEKFHIEKLTMWAYIKWLNTYANEPLGFWNFAGDFIGCDFSSEIKGEEENG